MGSGSSRRNCPPAFQDPGPGSSKGPRPQPRLLPTAPTWTRGCSGPGQPQGVRLFGRGAGPGAGPTPSSAPAPPVPPRRPWRTTSRRPRPPGVPRSRRGDGFVALAAACAPAAARAAPRRQSHERYRGLRGLQPGDLLAPQPGRAGGRLCPQLPAWHRRPPCECGPRPGGGQHRPHLGGEHGVHHDRVPAPELEGQQALLQPHQRDPGPGQPLRGQAVAARHVYRERQVGLVPRRHRGEQAHPAAAGRRGPVQHPNHLHGGLRHGPGQVPHGRAGVHAGAGELWLLLGGHRVLLVGKPGADPRAGQAAAGPVHHHQLPLRHGADELQVGRPVPPAQPALPPAEEPWRLHHPVLHALRAPGGHVLGLLLDQPGRGARQGVSRHHHGADHDHAHGQRPLLAAASLGHQGAGRVLLDLLRVRVCRPGGVRLRTLQRRLQEEAEGQGQGHKAKGGGGREERDRPLLPLGRRHHPGAGRLPPAVPRPWAPAGLLPVSGGGDGGDQGGGAAPPRGPRGPPRPVQAHRRRHHRHLRPRRLPRCLRGRQRRVLGGLHHVRRHAPLPPGRPRLPVSHWPWQTRTPGPPWLRPQPPPKLACGSLRSGHPGCQASLYGAFVDGGGVGGGSRGRPLSQHGIKPWPGAGSAPTALCLLVPGPPPTCLLPAQGSEDAPGWGRLCRPSDPAQARRGLGPRQRLTWLGDSLGKRSSWPL